MSKFFLRCINFILFSNIFIALCAVCMIQNTIVRLDLHEYILPYSLLVFFSTLFIYNLQRVFYAPPLTDELNSVRRKWIFAHPVLIKSLAVIGFIGSVFSFFFNDPKLLLYLSPLMVLSLAYFSRFVKLRKKPWLKLLTLVFVWTMVTAVVPLLICNKNIFTGDYNIFIFSRFCFMMAICIPFDIRDLSIDKADKISTLPQVIGVEKAKLIAVGFMVLFACSSFFEFSMNSSTTKLIIPMLIASFINTFIIIKTNVNRNEYFYILGIDGTMIIQYLLFFIVRYLL